MNVPALVLCVQAVVSRCVAPTPSDGNLNAARQESRMSMINDERPNDPKNADKVRSQATGKARKTPCG